MRGVVKARYQVLLSGVLEPVGGRQYEEWVRRTMGLQVCCYAWEHSSPKNASMIMGQNLSHRVGSITMQR